jgi:hypothetical protein
MARDHTLKLRQWQQQGWKISKTSGGHMKMTHPEAIRPVFVSSTPSDHRALLNAEAQMRNVLSQQERRKVTDFRGKSSKAEGGANV